MMRVFSIQPFSFSSFYERREDSSYSENVNEETAETYQENKSIGSNSIEEDG